MQVLTEVEIEFLIRIPSDDWDDCQAAISDAEKRDHTRAPGSLESLRETLLQRVDRSAPISGSLIEEIESASSFSDLRIAFQNANSITVRDTGSGMSLSILADAFLTIGTRFRRVEREKTAETSKGRVTLGDKGVGRLSVMRSRITNAS